MNSHGRLSAYLFASGDLGSARSRTPIRRRAMTVAFALSFLYGSLTAAAGPNLAVHLDALLWEPGRTGWVAIADNQRVIPGDRILYTVRLENGDDEPAGDPTAVGPVPVGTTLAADTATTSDELTVEYSLDGGQTFSAHPTITVTDQDGRARSVPAPIDQYTTVRWTWNTALAPGAMKTVSYQVRVR